MIVTCSGGAGGGVAYSDGLVSQSKNLASDKDAQEFSFSGISSGMIVLHAEKKSMDNILVQVIQTQLDGTRNSRVDILKLVQCDQKTSIYVSHV